MFRPVRRKDRQWDPAPAREMLRQGEYGVLSMCGANGYGYGIPLNYVLEENHLYFHCAPEGFKLDSLRENNRASFCVVGPTQVIPGQFTTNYQSVLLFGRVTLELDAAERRHALLSIAAKYSPEFLAKADPYIEASFHRTRVLRFDIEHLSAKAKQAAQKQPDPGTQKS